jgi:flagellar basal body rod protein FlgG
MLISNATMRALDDVAVRERDVLQAYSPGAMPQRADVAKAQSAQACRDPLSVAPPADSYFITSDDRGRMLFTRDGRFSLQNGTRVDAQGRPMLGYANDGATLGPLHADSVDVALGFAETARIEANGTVTYERATIDPRTGRRELQRAIMGRLALARFAPGTKLQSVDPQHVTAPLGIVPHIGSAGDGNFGAVTPFARESSGIDIDAGLQRLQEAYLALDAIRAAGKAQGSVEKTTMDLLK